MQKVTALLIVYAVLVIASSVFWVWLVFSKSGLTSKSNEVHNSLTADTNRIEQLSETATDQITELTGRDMDHVKSDREASDIVKSNDL